MLTASKHRISSLVATFIWALTAMTVAAVNAVATVTSDNPAVLTLETNADGTYTVTVHSVGTANLVVTTPEDIPNGIPAITELFPFEAYEDGTINTHFTAEIRSLVEKPLDTGIGTAEQSVTDPAAQESGSGQAQTAA